MSFWIYNMGLAVPVSSNNLMVKRNVKSLRELSNTTDFSHSDESALEQQASQTQQARQAAQSRQAAQQQAPQAQTTPEPPPQPKAIVEYNQQAEEEPQLKPVTVAEEIMSTKIKCLFEDMKLKDAWAEFRQHRYRHFPIINKNTLIAGIISDRDMLTAAATNKSRNMCIREIMKQPVLTASADTPIAEVCHIMFNRHIGALPITNEKNKILGLITRSDILRSMIKHGPIQLWV